MENYWNKSIETMEREQIRMFQLKKLRTTVENIYTNAPYYRKKMQEKGMIPGDIKSIENLRDLPFTTKQGISEIPPFSLCAAPMSDIVRIHASSGTTGKQIILGYTHRDIDIWADCMARCLVMADANKDSLVQISYGYGLHTGGHGVHYGVEKLGAIAIPASVGNTQRQASMLINLGVTHLCCTPSYAMHIADVINDMGFTRDDLKLKAGCLGAEPCSTDMRMEIENRLGLRVYDLYGACEVMGPSVSHECRYQNGLHIWEDCYIPEIINPDTEEPVNEGETGELVITTISKEGTPLLRYRTRDICSLTYEKCACGRTHVRMSKLANRTDNAISIRGVRIFPARIKSALLNMGELQPRFQLIVERMNYLDSLTVEIEMSDMMFSDNVKGIEEYKQKISKKLENVLSIKAKIRIVEPRSIICDKSNEVPIIDKRT